MDKNVKIAKELIKLAKNLVAAKEDEVELPDNLSPMDFYSTYIQDNDVFSGMPDECWTFVKENADKVYKEALSIYGDEWEVTEAAVRRVLNNNGLDGENW